MIRFDRFPGGTCFALTLSYDDGRDHDRRLVEIMNKYGIKGSFHLNSSRIGAVENCVTPEEMPELYKNHEISCHGVYHYSVNTLPPQNVILELLEDRKALENIAGYPVRGMSYANGGYSDEAISALKNCGIVYSRTTAATHGFGIPEDFMKWHPTCHHRDCIEDGKRFLAAIERGYVPFLRVFYVWGHSYEFANENNWELIEEFCKMMSGNDKIWYATNIEIYEYIMAQKALIISADNTIVRNPTDITVWFSKKGVTYSVKPGETIKID